MAAIGISQSGALAPDSGKARVSAASIFELVDHKSKIDSTDNSGITLEIVKGDIMFQHVSFRYPNRPDVEIFKDLCLAIHSGKVSIVHQLLLFCTFYNTNSRDCKLIQYAKE